MLVVELLFLESEALAWRLAISAGLKGLKKLAQG